MNEKNFVGLAVSNDYIACGSETNEVFVYHKVGKTNYIPPTFPISVIQFIIVIDLVLLAGYPKTYGLA